MTTPDKAMPGQHVLRRHDLVRLSPRGWDQALAGLSGEAAALGMYWRAHHLPVVVRRKEPGTESGTSADAVCLGIPAPPDARSGQKLRVGFTVAQGGIESARAPLLLAEAVVPAAWRAAFGSLSDALRKAGTECRVFGSVAMQTLTGQRYLTPSSDIDLLLHPADALELDAALAVLREHARRLPLDGEIVFPSGHAVSWKEWLTVQGHAPRGGDRVLAKHIDTVALLRRDALLEQFTEAHHG